jgi:hypothetical protein
MLNLYIANENLLKVSYILMSLVFSGLARNAGGNLFFWRLLPCLINHQTVLQTTTELKIL